MVVLHMHSTDCHLKVPFIINKYVNVANALGYVLAKCVGGLKYDLFSFDEKQGCA